MALYAERTEYFPSLSSAQKIVSIGKRWLNGNHYSSLFEWKKQILDKCHLPGLSDWVDKGSNLKLRVKITRRGNDSSGLIAWNPSIFPHYDTFTISNSPTHTPSHNASSFPYTSPHVTWRGAKLSLNKGKVRKVPSFMDIMQQRFSSIHHLPSLLTKKSPIYKQLKVSKTQAPSILGRHNFFPRNLMNLPLTTFSPPPKLSY